MNFRFLQLRSLKARVTLFTLAIFLLGIWLLAFIASGILHEDMQRISGEQQFSTASFIAAEINDELEERQQALEKVAERISPAMLVSTAALQAFLETNLVFQNLFNAGIFVTASDGTALADVPAWRQRTGVNFMDRDYLISALRHGKSTISQPVIDKKLLTPVFAMAVPIRDPQGQVIGALVGITELGLPNFLDIIKTNHYGRNGSYMLVARQNRLVVTASDQRRAMEVLPEPDKDPLLGSFIQGHEGSAVGLNPLGEEMLASARSVSAADWVLVAEIPTEDAFVAIHQLLWRLLLATLLLTLLAGALTWWMVRHQLSPMLTAVNTLAVMARSSQPLQALPITRSDEIGDLIGGFNHLISELGKKEAFIQQILDTSSVAIFLLDPQGRITLANQRMAELFGYPVQALLGLDYVALVDPAERAAAQHKMQALLSGASLGVGLDRLYWRADKSRFWGHLSGNRFVDAEGKQHGLIGVIADISERKSAEEKLLQHRNSLSAIIENFPGGISMMDADLRMTLFNEQFKKLLDFPDALLEQPDLCLEDIMRFNAQRGEYGAGDVEEQVSSRVERARKFEPHKFERVRPNGTVLEVRGELVPGGGFVTTYLDITERKHREDVLRESEARLLRFRMAMDATTDAIYLVDRASMRFTDVNSSACNMLGLTREQVMEAGPEGVLQVSREELAGVYDAVIAAGGVSEPIEALRTRRNGSKAWVEIRRHAQHSDAGWLIVTVARDVTERKQMEEQVRQLAFYDPLTKLPNRRLFGDRLSQAIAASRRSGCYGALMFLDLDQFKVLNDTHGHEAGDLLLIEAARRLKDCVREIDTVARLGGDEFVVVVSDLNANKAESSAQALVIAEKIRTALAEPYLLTVRHEGRADALVAHQSSASIGVVVFIDSEGRQEDFLRWADAAMYQAKEAGSNLIRFHASLG